MPIANPSINPERFSLRNLRAMRKRDDPLYGYFFAQNCAAIFLSLFHPRKVKPNHITALSLACSMLAAIFFAFGDYSRLLLGMALLNIALVFDCVDGMLARVTNTQSAFGAWFDYHSDKIKDGVILLSFAFGTVTQQPEHTTRIFIAAFLGIFFHFLRKLTTLQRDISSLQKTGHKDTHRITLSTSNQIARSLRQSLTFQIADRVAFWTIISITNLASFGIILYAMIQFGYAFASAITNYRFFAQQDHQKHLTQLS